MSNKHEQEHESEQEGLGGAVRNIWLPTVAVLVEAATPVEVCM